MNHRSHATHEAAHLIDPAELEPLDVLGPTVEFVTRPDPDEPSPCVMRGTMPPGGIAPLHSHPDSETFIVVSGEYEGLSEGEGGFRWNRIGAGDVFHVPAGAKHAFRNTGDAPAVTLIVTTARLGRFFEEIAVPVAGAAGAPSAERIRHFQAVAERYGHWIGSPEENAEVGLNEFRAGPGTAGSDDHDASS